jgi:hypothetical protein
VATKCCLNIETGGMSFQSGIDACLLDPTGQKGLTTCSRQIIFHEWSRLWLKNI